MFKKELLKYGLAQLMKDEYIYPVVEYAWDNRSEHLKVVVTVKSNPTLDGEVFLGVWYGVEVFDKEELLVSIPIMIEPDLFKITDKACRRRKRNLVLSIDVAEYIKKTLTEETRITRTLKKVTIENNLMLGKSFFNPESESSECL